MKARFRFKDWAKAQEVKSKLPSACQCQVLTDRTDDLYLEVDSEYEDYIERYLYTPYREQ